ncbi:hypothetical protein FRB93_012258 [Tulasnella sp. JGI-2019a]|nr:hypothetical protein FRB93_012258 [Tulasnella sp. JGI-2019a]
MSSSTSSTSPRSDASSSSGTRPTTESSPPSTVSSHSQPRTPRTPSRYPADLSVRTTNLRPARGNISPGSGKPYTYQSLEDLLRVHGYRETRIFSPETERVISTSPPAGSNIARRSKDNKHVEEEVNADTVDSSNEGSAGVAGMVASLFSGWVPGASSTLGCAKGRRIQHERAEGRKGTSKYDEDSHQRYLSAALPIPALDLTEQPRSRDFLSLGEAGGRVPRTTLTNVLESSLRKVQQPRGTLSRASSFVRSPDLQVSHHHLRPESPASLTPSSSSSTIRPSARQNRQPLDNQHSGQVLKLPRPSGPPQLHQYLSSHTKPTSYDHLRPPNILRHAVSAPNVKRNDSRLRSQRPGIRPAQRLVVASQLDQKGTRGWFNSFSRMVSYAAAIPISTADDEPACTDYAKATSPRRAPSRERSDSPHQRSSSNLRHTAQGEGRSVTMTQHFVPRLVVPSAPTVQVGAVMCKSAPSSRSNSLVRKDGRREISGGKARKNDGRRGTTSRTTAKQSRRQSLLLSPSFTVNDEDPTVNLWGDDFDEADAAATLDDQIDSDDEDDDEEPPNLRAILSTHLTNRLETDLRRRSGSSSSSESLEPELDSPVARRQRSIRSLRAHLATSATPGSGGIPALPSVSAHYNATERESSGNKVRGLFPGWLSPGVGGTA